MRAWRKSGSGRLITANGRLVLCNTCPCGAQLVGDVVIALMNDNCAIDDDLEVYLNGTLIGTHDGNANDGGGSLGPGFNDPTPYSYFVTIPTFDGSLWVDELPPVFSLDHGVQRFHTYFSPGLLINGTNTLRVVSTADINNVQVSGRVFRTTFNGTNWVTTVFGFFSFGANEGQPAVTYTGTEDSFTFTYPF